MLIAYHAKTRSVFLFGFAKSAQANIDDDELETAREIAQLWLKADERALTKADFWLRAHRGDFAFAQEDDQVAATHR